MKKIVLLSMVMIAIIIAGTMFYCSDYMNFKRNGYLVDWDDPWMFDGTTYYYCKFKANGKVIEQWLTETETRQMINATHLGYEFIVP